MQGVSLIIEQLLATMDLQEVGRSNILLAGSRECNNEYPGSIK